MYEEKEGEYELVYRYDVDGRLFTVNRYRYSDGRSDLLYAVHNTRGDLIELRTGSGSVNNRYSYDSWGRLVSVTNSSGTELAPTTVGVQNSVRYRGYIYDTETGLYYLQSRYYDPETGRFLNADDVDYIGYSSEDVSYNAFAYCENNAVNCADYFGLFANPINNVLNLLSILKVIMKRLYISYERAFCYTVVKNAPFGDLMLSMESIEYNLSVDNQYSIYSVNVYANTFNLLGFVQYELIAFVAQKESWEQLLKTVNKIKDIKEFVSLVNDLVEEVSGVSMGAAAISWLAKNIKLKDFKAYRALTRFLRNHPQIKVLSAATGISVIMLSYLVGKTVDKLNADVQEIGDEEYLTIYWLITEKRYPFFSTPTHTALYAYSVLAALGV